MIMEDTKQVRFVYHKIEKNINIKKMDNKLNWRSWCRLCATMNAENNIRVHLGDESTDVGNEETTITTNISMAEPLERYFYVNFRDNANGEELPNSLCMDCVSLINSLEKFAERVSRVQQMFDSLNWTTEVIDLDAIRLNFGISDGDHFVLTKQLKPEVHYIGSEQQVDNLKNVDTEDPLEMQPQIKTESQLDDDAVAIEYEIEQEKDDNYIENDDDDNDTLVTDSWYSCEQTEVEKLLKHNKKVKNGKLISIDTDKDVQTCKECHKKYRNMRQHMKRAHSIILPPEKHRCTECDFVSNKKCWLKRHMLVHTPKELRRNIPCKYCDQKFISVSRANIHMRQNHMKIFRNMCDQCGMTLNSATSLRVHKYMHEGLNPFKCEVCGRGFKVINKLKLHMDLHSDINFPCPQCGREFRTRISLRRHLPSHSDVKKFKCNFCESSFKSQKTLKNHLIMHTGLKMFNCNFCDRTFATGSSCRLHKRTMHPKELAAFEAAGNAPPVHNIPTLAALRAMKIPSKVNN